MLYVLAIFAAGLFAGLWAAFARSIRSLNLQYRRLDAERMLWANKAMAREGQSPLFSEDAIRSAAAASPPDIRPRRCEPGKPFTITSPFRRGIQKARERAEHARKSEIGASLDPSVKDAIAREKEKLEAA